MTFLNCYFEKDSGAPTCFRTECGVMLTSTTDNSRWASPPHPLTKGNIAILRCALLSDVSTYRGCIVSVQHNPAQGRLRSDSGHLRGVFARRLHLFFSKTTEGYANPVASHLEAIPCDRRNARKGVGRLSFPFRTADETA